MGGNKHAEENEQSVKSFVASQLENKNASTF
jgi:hypothetical protein